MTLYEVNKQAYASLPKMTQAELHQAYDKFVPYIKNRLPKVWYMMLLCHEKRDYTTFRVDVTKAEKMWNEIIAIFKNRDCTMKGVEFLDNGTIEFWVQDNKSKECSMYLLFDYDWGVIDLC